MLYIFFCMKLVIFQLHLICWNHKNFFDFFLPKISLACFLARISTWCIEGLSNKNLIFSRNYGISCSSPLSGCIDQKSGLKKSQATTFCVNIPCKKLRGNKTVCFTIACFITSAGDQKPNRTWPIHLHPVPFFFQIVNLKKIWFWSPSDVMKVFKVFVKY